MPRAVGLRLAREVPGVAGRGPLLAAGAILSDRYAAAVERQGITRVWVDAELSAGIEPAELVPEPVLAQVANVVREMLEAARAAAAASRSLPEEAVRALVPIVDRILNSLADPSEVGLAAYDLGAASEYLHRHPVDVAALGLLLARDQYGRVGWRDARGRHFDRLDERLRQLGLGLLLADVGKMALPPGLLVKPGALDPAEWALVHGHPEAGVRLAGPGAGALVSNAIRGHHERADGSGYPRGAAGDDIHEFAAFAAVADVYTAMTSERPYRTAAPAHAAVATVCDPEAGFHPEVVLTFRRLVAPYPVGTEVALDGGGVGVVARVDPARPGIAVVRVPGADGPVDMAVDAVRGVPA